LDKITKYGFRLLIFSAILLAGCSVKKNNILSRNYHALLARDNGYFNAGNKYNDAVAKLEKSHDDKYDRVLSIYKLGDATKAKAIYPDMDVVIKKVSFVIQKQTMWFKDKNGKEYKEHNRWIPQNWLLLGKARFYKREYLNAIETFQFIGGRYGKTETRFDAFLWMLKTYNELAYVSESQNMIDFLGNDPQFPKRLKGDFYASCANYDLMTNGEDKAVEDLTKSIVFTKKRLVRARYIFILAQLYQKQGNNKKAVQLYDKVVSMNPPYELGFNAEINSALLSDANSKNSLAAKKKLIKMSKDYKNADYLDQIYYALAGISLKEGNRDEAIDYLHKSIKASKANLNQKGLSFLALGKIYFDIPEYKKAQQNYDSCIAFLPKDHPDYTVILAKRNNLTKLIRNLNIIAHEDSLQKVAGLTEAQRNALVDSLVQQEKDDKAAEKKKELEDKNKVVNGNFVQNQNQKDNQGGQWYFYNSSLISMGFSEFQKKWGNRKLEDDWRRSSKVDKFSTSPDSTLETADVIDKDTTTAKDSSNSDIAARERFLKNIPINDKALEASNAKIAEAYYSIGLIYKEQFNDYLEAIKAFETLNTRFPDNKFLLPAYYNLYRTNLSIKNQERADYYKNLILSKYPDSEFANLIKNPDYVKDKETSVAALNAFYEETYTAYLGGKYDEVRRRKIMADSLFPENQYKPKFDYLQTLSIGKTSDIGDLSEFSRSLKSIVRDYPKDSVSVQAQQILDLIAKMKSKQGGTWIDSIKQVALDTFTFRPDTIQFYVIAFPNKALDANQLKSKFTDYIKKYYSSSGLTVMNLFLDANTQMLVVKKFSNKWKGMDFFYGIKLDEDPLKGFSDVQFTSFMIDEHNYGLLYKEKDLSKYVDFFNGNYLKSN
jgi:tetratricopeptide (TPR) repeat protein